MIHHLADVTSINIGSNTNIWQFCVVLENAKIGSNCNICSNVFVENRVEIGNNVTIKSGVQIWDGVFIKDNVFIGPNVTFTNDLIPRSKNRDIQPYYLYKCLDTIVERGASVGANSTIIAGNVIGEYALIGAGSVITKDIPAHTVWYGNPARLKGYITVSGILLDQNKKDKNGLVRSLNE